jgi:hypothetical protein
MTALVYVGSLSLAALAPSVYASIGEVAVSLNAALQGNLALNASLSASPPTLATVLAAAEEFSTQLVAAEVSIPPVPNVSFSLSDCVTLTANLNASFGLLVTLEALLSAAIGAYAFTFAGQGNALGLEVGIELGSTWPDGAPTTGTCNALLFGAVSSVAQTQLAAFLNGLPPSAGGLSYVGKIGLAAMSPVTNAATAQGNAAINVQLVATAALQASLAVTPPSFPTMLTAQAKFQANLSAQAAIPIVKFALAATASAAASLSAKFGLLCQLGGALDRFDATLFVYTYAGVANAMGTAIGTALASTWGDGTTPTSSACTAVLLGATDTPTWTALTAFFGGA